MITAFAAASAVLWLVRLGMFVALHLVRSDYSPVRHAVSDYAVGRTRVLSSAMAWVTAAAWAALAGAIWFGLEGWIDRGGITVCLVVLAAIFVALPFVPTTLEGEKQTLIGRLHMLAAVAWFALSYACMGNFVRLADGGFAAVLNVLSWIALVGLVALVAALIVPGLRTRAFGISERVFIVAVNLFYLVVGLALLVG